MAVTKRTVRLAIERVSLSGVNPGDRHRFERALRDACAEGLREMELRGSLREHCKIRVPAFKTGSPEALAIQLADTILEIVGER